MQKRFPFYLFSLGFLFFGECLLVINVESHAARTLLRMANAIINIVLCPQVQ